MFRLAASRLTAVRSFTVHPRAVVAMESNAFLSTSQTAPNYRYSNLFRTQRGFAAAAASMGDIKDLRARSGAPIMECKKALKECDGDLEKAMDWLRQHGAAKASSKVSGRDADEGLVACKVSPDGTAASIVQVSSETDFAGRSSAFVQLVTHVADATLASTNHGSIETDELMELSADSKSIKAALEEAIVSIRENLGIKSAIRLQATDGLLVGYVHGRVDGSNAGSSAALVEIAANKDSANTQTMEEAGKKLAMHVVAAKPLYLDPKSVPQQEVDRERAILESQLADERKPPEIIEKIVNGRLRKFYEGICLTEQQHMAEEGNPKVSQSLKELGLTVKRFELLSI